MKPRGTWQYSIACTYGRHTECRSAACLCHVCHHRSQDAGSAPAFTYQGIDVADLTDPVLISFVQRHKRQWQAYRITARERAEPVEAVYTPGLRYLVFSQGEETTSARTNDVQTGIGWFLFEPAEWKRHN